MDETRITEFYRRRNRVERSYWAATWGPKSDSKDRRPRYCPHAHRSARRARACRRDGWRTSWGSHPAGKGL
jgi:hypothetical protein